MFPSIHFDISPLSRKLIRHGAVLDAGEAFGDEVLWGQVNLFHRATARIERSLDENEQAQRRLQREQDRSEVKSNELERLTTEGIERARAFLEQEFSQVE